MRKNYRLELLGGAVSIFLSGPAMAQGVGPTEGAEAAPRATGIEEIVVTARRREESSQTVPVALTAFNNEKLSELRIATAQDLQGKVPSLVVGNGGQTSRNVETVTIRGQGATFQSSPGVVSYFAEVPLPQSNFTGAQGGGAGMFYDLGSLQVLKGPQGTLFGRNTTGGAVLYEPKRPTDRLEGYVQAEVGNYNARGLEGAINLPVIEDKLLMRVAGSYARREGFTRDINTGLDYDNRDRWSGRIGITFKPADGIENYLMAYYLESDTNGTSSIPIAYRPGSGIYRTYGNDAALFDRLIDEQKARGPRKVALSADGVDLTRTWGITDIFSAQLSDNLTLRNIFSYARLQNVFSDDSDGSILPYRDTIAPEGTWSTDLDNLTEELQLQGSALDKKLDFTIGGYYESSSPKGPQLRYSRSAQQLPPSAPTISRDGENRKAYALYAQSSLDFGAFLPELDSLRLTAGYRYSWDRKDAFSDFPSGLIMKEYKLRSSAPNWTVGLDYRINPRFMTYAKISRGYKSGGANRTGVNPTRTTFRPEYVTSYETGVKADWKIGGMPIRTNLDYYYSDYTDIQRSGSDRFNGLAGSATVNAGKARIQGFEAEITLQPMPGLELSSAYSYMDAKYQKFELPVIDASGAIIGSTDLSDIPFQFAPKHILNLGARYATELGGQIGSIVASANYSYTSQQYTSPTAPPSQEPYAFIPSYGLLNLSLSWKNFLGSSMDATLYATNVTNRLYVVSARASYGSGYATAVYGEPRMYGLQLRYRFGNE